MKKNVTNFMLMLSFILCGLCIQAQSKITGKVSNANGDPMPYALVHIPALGIGTIANESGMYEIMNVPNGRWTMEVSSIGYDAMTGTVQVSADGSSEQNFTMSEKSIGLNTVIVTGNANPKAAIESSISVSSLKPKDININSPRTTAEIFRAIPGIRSESSGGDGNSNITVRGVPISAGGSRYLLIQEDGLPVLQFGDMAFGTQDQFLRYDNMVSKIEAVKGGSASVLASNSPAGIINFISKTGESQGGSVATTFGLDYNNFRTDFEVGTPIGNNMSVAAGGFFRTGDGPRKAGFTSNNGGQFRLNLTKRFNGGFARIYTKLLDDRTAAYMPMPIEVSGSNESPKWKSLSNYNALHGTLQTINLLKDKTIGGDGNILSSDVADGMHSKTKSIGAEFGVNLSGGWYLNNKTRFAANSGQFLAPFPANVGNAGAILGGLGKAYYAGTNTEVNANGVYMRMHLFNTTLNNFNNLINNMNISKSFGKTKLNLGIYKSLQNVSMSWNWNTYLMEVSDDNARMIDVRDSLGNSNSPGGLLAYGVPAWGNCCNRNFDTKYDITAPYADVEIQLTDKLNLDAGVRYDLGHVFGSFSGGNGQTSSIDMNGNGKIDANEKAVATTSTVTTPVNYHYDYLSYSVGVNYLLTATSSVFVRTSSGGSASADRVLFNGFNYTSDDDKSLDAQKVNTVAQTELGYKCNGDVLAWNATAFLANTKESNYEATTQKKIDNKYRSIGLELDAIASITSAFNLRCGLTYTNAKITASKDASVVDNTPRRTPSLMFNLAPVYAMNKFSVGIGLIGATKAFTQDDNKLIMPGYVLINPFITYNIRSNFALSVNINNVLDALAITESEEGSITSGTTNILRARPLPGRSASLSLQYHF